MAEIDSTGRPAYVYNASDNKWYEVAGKVDPTANYNWTGTHTFSNPVTINNAVVISKRFNVFTNQTTRSAAMQTLGTTDRGHISFLQNDATSGSPVNRLEYWDGSAWATLVDPAVTVTLSASQTLTNKTLGTASGAPFIVNSTTAVTNLNSDLLDGQHGSYYLAASNLTGQTGMWTSTNRPGAYRLYRNDNDSSYNVQTYWTGSRWRLRGYLNDSYHAEAEVYYSDQAGNADTLDGNHSSAFAGAGHGHDYVINNNGTVYGAGLSYPNATAAIYPWVGGATANMMGFSWGSGAKFWGVVDNNASILLGQGSDRRIKENIEEMPSIIDNILLLNPVTYNLKDAENNIIDQKEFGLIADEVQEIFPSIVTGEKDGELLQSVHYAGIVPMLIKAIQEQQQQINELKSLIEVQ